MRMFVSKRVTFEFPIIFFCKNKVIFSLNFRYNVASNYHCESVFQYEINKFCDTNKPNGYSFCNALMVNRFDRQGQILEIGPNSNWYSPNFEMAREKNKEGSLNYALVANLLQSTADIK